MESNLCGGLWKAVAITPSAVSRRQQRGSCVATFEVVKANQRSFSAPPLARSQGIPPVEPKLVHQMACHAREVGSRKFLVILTGKRIGRAFRRKGRCGCDVRDRRSGGLSRGHHELIFLSLKKQEQQQTFPEYTYMSRLVPGPNTSSRNV